MDKSATHVIRNVGIGIIACAVVVAAVAFFVYLDRSRGGYNAAWITHRDVVQGYAFAYPSTMEKRGYDELAVSDLGDYQTFTLAFPQKAFEGSTYDEALVRVFKTPFACTEWPDLVSEVPVTSVKTVRNTSFDLRIKTTDGSEFETQEYSLMKDGECYRFTLRMHHIDPVKLFPQTAVVETKRVKNNEVRKNVVRSFEAMLTTFSLARN